MSSIVSEGLLRCFLLGRNSVNSRNYVSSHHYPSYEVMKNQCKLLSSFHECFIQRKSFHLPGTGTTPLWHSAWERLTHGQVSLSANSAPILPAMYEVSRLWPSFWMTAALQHLTATSKIFLCPVLFYGKSHDWEAWWAYQVIELSTELRPRLKRLNSSNHSESLDLINIIFIWYLWVLGLILHSAEYLY